MKFYRSKQFRELNEVWRAKLKESGFEDHEDSKEKLKDYDRRTQAWENRDFVLEFFLKLGQYLNDNHDVPPEHRQILTLYIDGTFSREISRDTGWSYAYVKKVISIYKLRILNRSPFPGY